MTALTDRSHNDTYKDLLQVSNSNAGIDTTRRPFEDGEGTQAALKIATTSYGADGRVYVELDSGSSDLAATLEALDTTAINHLVIDKPGTYVTGPVTINNLRAITIGPGVVIQFKASQGNDSRLFTIARSDFVFHLYGTLDGNYANQSTATGHSAIYVTADRVKVFGHGRLGYVTGWRGNAVYFVDCDDGHVEGLRLDNCLTRCIFGQLLTNEQTLSRFTVKDISADRTAQGASAEEECVGVMNSAGGTNVLVRPVLERIDTYLDANADAFGVEVFGGAAGGLLRPSVTDVYAEGGGCILSVDHSSGGVLKNIRGYDFNGTGIEIAHCTEGLTLDGFEIDGNSSTTTSGVVVDNQSDNGVDIVIANGTIRNVTTYGVHLKGASGGTTPKETTVSAVNVRTSTASAVGFLAEYAPNSKFIGVSFRGAGSGQTGLFISTGSTGCQVDSPKVELTVGSGNAIQILENDCTLTNPNLRGAADGDNAIQIADCQYVTVLGGRARNFGSRLLLLVVSSGETIGHLNIDGLAGDGGGDVALTNNSGTVDGDTIQIHIAEGWAPYSVLIAPRFTRFHGTTSSNNVLEGGIFVGDPNSAPVVYQGYAYYNGNLHTNKSGTWTAAN